MTFPAAWEFQQRDRSLSLCCGLAVTTSYTIITPSSKVHLLVRGDKLRASKAMQDRTLGCKSVTVHFNTGIEDAFGDTHLTGLKLINTKVCFVHPILGSKATILVVDLTYATVSESPSHALTSFLTVPTDG